MSFWILFFTIAVTAYPVHGAVMYGDPWKWPLKPTTHKEPEADE